MNACIVLTLSAFSSRREGLNVYIYIGDLGGGYYDDVEVGRLGTNPSADAQALSFEMDLRKDLPWASPAADRLARRRPSVGYDVYLCTSYRNHSPAP